MLRSLYVLFCVLCSLLCLASGVGPTATAAPRKIRFHQPKGKAPLQPKDIAWRPASGTQAQTWILWAWNDQGYLVTAFFISTRFLMVSRFGVQLTIYTPKGRVIHRVKEYTMDKLKARKDRLFLEVNKLQHFWRGGLKQGKVLVGFGKWAAFFKYKRILSGFRAAAGPMKFGPKVFEGLPFGPRLQVTGALRLNGKRVAFRGVGYADYSLQTIIPKRLARRWYGVRGINKRYTVIASQLWATKRWQPTSVPMLSIAKGDKWLFHSKPGTPRFRTTQYRNDPKSKHRLPMRVVYRAKAPDGTRYSVIITHKKQVTRLDLMSHINPVLRFVLQQLLSRPFVFRYQAQVVLRIKPPKGALRKELLTGYSEWMFVQ